MTVPNSGLGGLGMGALSKSGRIWRRQSESAPRSFLFEVPLGVHHDHRIRGVRARGSKVVSVVFPAQATCVSWWIVTFVAPAGTLNDPIRTAVAVAVESHPTSALARAERCAVRILARVGVVVGRIAFRLASGLCRHQSDPARLIRSCLRPRVGRGTWERIPGDEQVRAPGEGLELREVRARHKRQELRFGGRNLCRA